LQDAGDLLVGQRRDGSSSSMSFFTRRLRMSNDVFAPSGPCTLSEKKYRNSNTPCGVCAYLLATAQADGGRVHADFLGHFLDHHGLQLIDAFFEESC